MFSNIKKDLVLLISNKFTPEDGPLLGGTLPQQSTHTYCLLKSTNEKRTKLPSIGKCEKNVLQINVAKSIVSTRKLNFSEPLPLENEPNSPTVTCLSFDEDLYRNCERIKSYNGVESNCLELLHSKIGNINNISKKIENKSKTTANCKPNKETLKKLHEFLRKSYWYTHFTENISSYFDRKHPIEDSNLISGRVFDFILGLITIYFILLYKFIIWETILHSTKYIIDELKKVLNILMGSPAGLKLNCALNQTLGIFFFYHISLWKAFIEGVFTVSASILYGFIVLGSLGLSYQIALCADVLMFLTFHVYCIYVYAARLFRVQIYSITSLWRLFIGRKYNPLKNRVDSFQYTHNQLFVGTLGFTVLLFLLPTTLLYYVVFTIFRVVVLIICKLFLKTARVLSTTPLYFYFLRVISSSRIKGTLYIYTTKNPENSTLKIHASLELLDEWFLNSKSLKSDQHGRSINEYINSICTGKLL